jgi:quinol-cytochrome oxidoreductase complex cytochrome b subunit
VFPSAPSYRIVGLALEVLTHVHLLISPWLFTKIEREYGVCRNSVTILLWSFVASMIVLAERSGPDGTIAAVRTPHLTLGESTPDASLIH